MNRDSICGTDTGRISPPAPDDELECEMSRLWGLLADLCKTDTTGWSTEQKDRLQQGINRGRRAVSEAREALHPRRRTAQ